jgi:hypothetical protein
MRCTSGRGRYDRHVCARGANATEDLVDLAGAVVTFEDVALVDHRICTKMKCSPKNPCCNRCEISFGVPVSGEVAWLAESLDAGGPSQLTCAGTECGVAKECPVDLGTRYRLSGRVVAPTDPPAGDDRSLWQFEVLAASPVSR